jgi:hypothetical protein
MADPHVVTGLRAKRAELAGEIQAAEKCIAQLRADLIHLDATLRLFDPQSEPETIASKRPYRRREWFKNGELPRLLLSTLRKAAEPMSASELALAAMATKGWDASDAATLEAISTSIGGYLRSHRDRLVERAGRENRHTVWRVRRE